MSPSNGQSPGQPARLPASQLLALAAFVLLTVIHTWPLASNPAHLSRNDSGDTLLNTWAIAWVAHQLPRDPVHLFDANIFYPQRLTLAYSEAMIVQSVLAWPILAAGGSPVLAYNLVLMAGFALTGWAFCLLLRRWTGSWAAGYIGGSLAAFNAHVLVRLPHLQTQHVEFVAVTLFALDRVIVSRRPRHAVLLGAGFALQGLTSVYLLVFSTWLLAFAVAARARGWLRRDPVKMIGLLAVAGITAVLLMAPYLLAYYRLNRMMGFVRTVADNRQYAGSWANYLSTGARVHLALWSRRFYNLSTSSAFPGGVALALASLAIAWPDSRRDARVRMCLIAGTGCIVVSMLPNAPIYPLLYRLVPLFRVVRVQAHIGQIVLLMVAVVAGFGVAGLGRRWRNVRSWPAVAVALCALVNVEALRAPLTFTPFSETPAVYDTLAQQTGAVIVELPFYAPPLFYANGSYMLNSTRHWRPMLNGYSGFKPASYDATYEAIKGFPDDQSLTALHDRGVTHIVVHAEPFCASAGPERCAAVLRSRSLELVTTDRSIYIFRLK